MKSLENSKWGEDLTGREVYPHGGPAHLTGVTHCAYGAPLSAEDSASGAGNLII
jgi:hypothetical protein